MDHKLNDRIWAISLMVIGAATIVLAGTAAVGLTLPDAAVRILGVLELLALPTLVVTTVRKVRSKSEDR